MPSPRIVIVGCLAAGLAPLGCSALPWLPLAAASPDRTFVSPPGEDGTQYVMVHSGRLTSARTLERRWKTTVGRTCDGEAMELSQSGYSRRQGGIVRSRTHEGYIQCLVPSGAEPGASPDAPNAADATAPAPTDQRRPRRRPRGRSTAGR